MDQFAAQLNCSKRTLYALASSKEQLAVLAVRHFFKRATEQVETAIARTRAPAKRVTRYLEAVAEALRPATRAFRDDIAEFRPATEIYEQNTLAAAHRVRELIDEGTRAGAFRRVHAAFVGEVVTATMRRITSGEIAAATGLSDAEAYSELAQLVVAAIRR
jgi:AcrR family transcriptional regulator